MCVCACACDTWLACTFVTRRAALARFPIYSSYPEGARAANMLIPPRNN